MRHSSQPTGINTCSYALQRALGGQALLVPCQECSMTHSKPAAVGLKLEHPLQRLIYSDVALLLPCQLPSEASSPANGHAAALSSMS